MEYIIGNNDEKPILKTIGDSHSNLFGHQTIVRDYPDQTITDDFDVVEKYHSDEDGAGRCYDFYEIKNHYRVIDKSAKLQNQIAENEQAIFELAELISEMEGKIDG